MKTYGVGPFRLDAMRLMLLHGDEIVPLGPKVVETLLALVERSGDVVPKNALLDRVWPDGFVQEANLTQNVYVLRRTFEQYAAENPIATVPRRGYRFVGTVRELDAVAIPADRPSLGAHRALAVAFAALFFVGLFVGRRDDGGRNVAAPLSARAQRLYDAGRYAWGLRTPRGVQESLGYFAGVIDADPQSAIGYAAMADANVTMADYCYGTHSPAVYLARAAVYAARAVALDPRSGEVHASVGFLLLHRRNDRGALTELRRAIASKPTYGPAHAWYGIALLRRGIAWQGVQELQAAVRLDPLSVTATSWLGSVAYARGKPSDAVLYARRALELSPRRLDAIAMMGTAYVAIGDLPHAVAAFRRYAAIDPYERPEAAALLAQAYAREHRPGQARMELAYAEAHAGLVDDAVLAGAIATVYPTQSRFVAKRLRGHPWGLAVEDAAHFLWVLQSRTLPVSAAGTSTRPTQPLGLRSLRKLRSA